MADHPDDEKLKQSNIVAFTSDPVTFQVMTATLNSLNIPDCFSYEGDLKKATQYLVEHRTAKILIVDLSNSDLPISDMRNLMEISEPGSYVVVLGTRNDIGLFRDLLRLGVTDYITKPINLDFMSRSLMTIIQGNMQGYTEQRVGKVITFVGVRGGIGTTTLATNVAWLLAQEKFKRTLLIDLDMHHGNSSLLLDLKVQNNLYEVLTNVERLDENLLESNFQKHSERLFVLGHQELLDKDFHCPPGALEELLPMVRNQFHYIIVDLPRIMNDATRLMLRYTSNIFMVVDPSLGSIRDAVRLLEMIGHERSKTKVLTVLNKVGHYTRGEITRESFAKSIGHPVDFIIPYDDTHPLIAANMGKPLASIPSAMSNALRAIANHISGTPQVETPDTWQDQIINFTNNWLQKSSSGHGLEELTEHFQTKLSEFLARFSHDKNHKI